MSLLKLVQYVATWGSDDETRGDMWVYNIRGLKIAARACFALAVIMALSAGFVLMKYGMNGSFWLLIAFASWGAWLGAYSLQVKRRRASMASSGFWSRRTGRG